MRSTDDQMIVLHGNEDPAIQQGSVIPPIYMNSLHVFPNMESYLGVDTQTDFIYGRVSNPTVHLVEEKLAGLERGKKALFFSSGMAALTTAIHACCKAGDHIICLHNCYGPTVEFVREIGIPKLGFQVSFVDATADAVISAIRSNTRLILLESPTSLVFEVLDLEAITNAAKARGVLTYIDNTYCTPLYQKPLELGIDIVMHTLSKYLGGHSDLIGGVLVCKDEILGRSLARFREFYGGVIGPMEGWLVLRGLRTLSARLSLHQTIALEVASFLEKHPYVEKVHYPGLPSHPQYELARKQQSGNCGLLSFEIKGSKEEAIRVCNALKVFQIGVSWGGFESLVVMPMYKHTPEHAALCGTGQQLIRIHCGLEGSVHLIDDLRQALDVRYTHK